jgi:hypothetical protein
MLPWRSEFGRFRCLRKPIEYHVEVLFFFEKGVLSLVNPTTQNTADLEIRGFPFGMLVAFAVFAVVPLLFAIMLFANPPQNIPTPVLWLLRIVLPLVSAVLLKLTWKFSQQPPLTLKLTSEGLWIQKHKVNVPWQFIKSAEIICPHERKSPTEKIADAVITALANGSRIKPIFVAISLTEDGKKYFSGRDFIGALIRKSLKLHEDFLISPQYLPMRKIPEIVTTIQKRADDSREGNMRHS